MHGKSNWILGVLASTLFLATLVAPLAAFCDEPAEKATPPVSRSVEELAKQARESVTLISVQGRDGKPHGLGTGFVIAAEGLIATNHHVIGEARPINVQLANGKQLKVVAIYASDRELDLAILKVDASDLPALPLADSGQVQDGEPIVVLGHPLGLKNSVVSGVVSGRREVENRPMLQLAIPIESGNSGGPVLDRQGRVVGIVTMKSLVTNNLGFAVEVNQLKPLLERPNPVPISRWLTIGALDAKEWVTRLGAHWQQRSGKISVSGGGDAFGRALCLRQDATLEIPFELAVQVRMDDESGAAGLIFHADESNRHYGFYPSNGKLRFSRFDGPVVQEWAVLREVPTQHYRPGEWNRLKVRIDSGKYSCYVNDQLVFEIEDKAYETGQIGIVKFRQTQAEFKGFEFGASLADISPSEQERKQLEKLLEPLPPLDSLTAVQVDELQKSSGQNAAKILTQKAEELEQKSKELRLLADDLFTRQIVSEIEKEIRGAQRENSGETPGEPTGKQINPTKGGFDLLRAALLVGKLDEQEIDVEHYLQQVARMTREIQAELQPDSSAQVRREALDKYLFQENGFHGSRFDYYHRANSYMNRLLDDHEGIPLTLAILYQEIGKRLGLTIEGIPLPGHFVVRYVDPDDENRSLYLDVFEGARSISHDELLRRAAEAVGPEEAEKSLRPATKQQMLQRMIANLSSNAQRENDANSMLRYYEVLVLLDPQSGRTRFDRARLRFQTGRHEQAIEELNWFLHNPTPGIDPDGVRAIQTEIQRAKMSH